MEPIFIKIFVRFYLTLFIGIDTDGFLPLPILENQTAWLCFMDLISKLNRIWANSINIIWEEKLLTVACADNLASFIV